MKVALHYIFLVGIPVLFVIVLLRFGENTLTAPIHVGGNWLLEFPSQTVKSSCADLNFDYEDPILNISQSGTHVVLSFNNQNHTTIKGTLTEQTIFAQSHTSNNTNKPDISVSITINPETEPDQIDGTLVVTACEETWSFTATRQPELDTSSAGDH